MHVRIFYVQASLPHLAPPLSMYMDHSESSLSFQTSIAQWTRARLVAPGWWYTHQCTSTHNHYHFCSVLCSNHYACVHTLQCACVCLVYWYRWGVWLTEDASWWRCRWHLAALLLCQGNPLDHWTKKTAWWICLVHDCLLLSGLQGCGKLHILYCCFSVCSSLQPVLLHMTCAALPAAEDL